MKQELSGKIVGFKVIKDEDEVKTVEKVVEKVVEIPVKQNTKRDYSLEGMTYKIKPQTSSSAIYITINDKEGSPFEMFINSKDTEHFQWTAALTRVVSAVMRREEKENMEFLVDELKSVVDPNGGYWSNGKYIKSIVSEIGMVLEQHLSREDEEEKVAPVYPKNAIMCHKCGEKALIKNEGCEECVACSYSKCS